MQLRSSSSVNVHDYKSDFNAKFVNSIHTCPQFEFLNLSLISAVVTRAPIVEMIAGVTPNIASGEASSLSPRTWEEPSHQCG